MILMVCGEEKIVKMVMLMFGEGEKMVEMMMVIVYGEEEETMKMIVCGEEMNTVMMMMMMYGEGEKPVMVSWMRHEDLHILSVGEYKYSSDERDGGDQRGEEG
ncbi:hypothetical protein Pcinc_021839 [Petrolisthes cinctipes]|uniref:Uncharacterized protein n=1 Tax=Petrolisthes cinctipes TaxID=88211 RepID=A0AAE1FF82_PETCI|nr:hypothetical protein Pcinc_021839 [Petrolisthes cinctipes]